MIDPADAIVVTDLDGTLLDHQSYDWSPALPTLEKLKDLQIPLILATSKTQAEVEDLNRKLGNRHPFIVENGGAVIIPNNYFDKTGETVMLGPSLDTLGSFLDGMQREGMMFRGFSDMSAEEVSDLTGLSRDDAHLAKRRITSEPIQWQDDEVTKKRFIEKAQKAGFSALQGGRFLTLGGHTDKGRATGLLLEFFEKHERRRSTIIALGDSGNDAALLSIADVPIWIRKKGATPDTAFMDRARCSIAYGPEGWSSTVNEVLRLDL